MNEPPIRVLLVDDDEDACVITRDLLNDIRGQKFKLEWANTYEGGLQAIERRQHDVYLIDYQLGARNGIELLLEASTNGANSPFILLTGQGKQDIDFVAMKAGAADYLEKANINTALLERSIRYAMERAHTLRQLRHLNETLEEKVKERTIQLEKTHEELRKAQEQFYQAQKMESLGTLAGGLAHDFGNFLAVIQLQTDLVLTKTNRENPVYSNLEKIRGGCLQANELIREVLLFSRRQTVQFSQINLNEVIANVTKIMLGTLGEKFSLEAKLEPGLPSVQAHAGHLQQVLMNLILNARDAMPDGGAILVTTESASIQKRDCKNWPDARPGKFVRLSVKDYGMGMDPRTISQIFEPFFTTKGPDKGTGLGLSVVYGIVKEHQAWIQVQSSPGQGATFNIYFPL